MNWQAWLILFALALMLVAGAVAAMAIGVVFRRPCLRGSCGGRELQGPNGEAISCGNCPNKKRPD